MKATTLRGFVFAVLICAMPALAANVVTVQTLEAEPGDTFVRVDIYAANDVDLLEYFNLLIFDATRLTFVDLVADRGGFWYGYYPTHIDGDHIYVHGWSDTYPDCIDPAAGDPGPPLYHLLFDVKPEAPEGLAAIVFGSDGAFEGHWNDCSGYSVSPAPIYHDGGVHVRAFTGVDDHRTDRLVAKAYPNPATGGTRIGFVLPATGSTEISVYDLTGRRVRTLTSGVMEAGSHGLQWDGADDRGRPAPGGVYFCRVRTATGVAVDKIMLIR